MQSNFIPCLNVTLVYEGGFANNPKDPGGRTMKGVTQTTFNAYLKAHGKASRDVKTITDTELGAIYKTGFWDKVNGDTLAMGVDLVTWDYAVNSGPARAKSALLTSVGGSDVDTIKKVCAKRLSFLKGLKTWATFGKGWGSRVSSVEAKGLAMAAGSKPKAISLLTTEANASDSRVQSHSGIVAANGVTAGAAAPMVYTSHMPMLALIALSAIVLAAGAFLIWRIVVAKTRSDAFKKEINGLQNA